MNAPFKQAERLGRLTTELGEDVLVLLRFDGTDYLNELFEYRVEALATRDDLDFDALIGTHATVEIEGRGVTRPFDGIVTSARWAGVGENGHRYNLTLRPWFWLAGKRRNQRIFHRKTVDQILKELLSDYAVLGDPHLEIKLANPYPELEYTVQYRESDLNFARRQMERFGISFFFRHEKGTHTLVITDEELKLEVIGERPFKRFDGHHQYEHEHFWEWAPERNFTTGAVSQTDYNFKHPTQKMDSFHPGDAQYAQGQIESFDYPGDYLNEDIGKMLTRMRTRQERGADRRNRAVGDCVSLSSGLRAKLGGDRIPGTGETYICLSATHSFVSEAYGSGGESSDGYSYSGQYVLMPDSAPMVPPKRTPLAVVQGPQTAVVVGEGEIDCDEYGRILVRFHWDLDKAYSMRCRVSQNWAGAGWGGMVIPRIGMEVVVEFLEGDPDKPLVTGNVFNGKNGVPYDLPKHKTRSTFRTNTHNGQRTGRGFNELRFEDQQGEEEIFVHAEKDRNEKIKNNHTERIDNNWVQSIGHNKAIQVRDSHDEVVGGSMSIQVGSMNYDSVVADAMNIAPEGISAAAKRLDLPIINAVGSGIYTLLAEKAIFETSLGMRNLSVGMVNSSHAGTTQNLSAGRLVQISAAQSVAVNGGADVAVQSGGEITINCGKASIILNSNGDVRISGRHLHFDFTGDAEINAEGKLSVNAAETELCVDEIFKINAKRVDIN